MIRYPETKLSRPYWSWIADTLVLGAAAAAFYVLLSFAPKELARVAPSVTVNLHPAALPGYAVLSFLRMCAAYVLSFLFTVVVGYVAARNKAARRIIIPSLDILQSLPVLSFLPAVLLAMIALFPRQTVGLEVGSVLLVFTGMVWNMAFSFYHSLVTIPEELMEAARAFRLSWWQRFTSLELPAGAIGLVWNSMLSWAGGWFFLMATESFSLGKQSFTLPGLGSYLSVAANKGDFPAILWGLGTLVAMIIALDQLVWRPLIAWSERFKIELSESQEVPTSRVLDLLRHSTLLPWARRQIQAASALAQHQRPLRAKAQRQPLSPAAVRLELAFSRVLIVLGLAAVAWGAVSLVKMIASVSAAQWITIGKGSAATVLRVEIALAISLAWSVPAGVAIGLRPRLAQIAQPIAQIAASVPATAVFPILLLIIIRAGGGLSIASILLMLLGTQWYVLFNAIAGAIALPRDLQEAAALMKLRGWMRWRELILPGIFPHLVTGGITAQGGAFNASIVSEYVVFEGKALQTVGLGALISASANNGDYHLLAAATVAMGTIVILINRLFWRRAVNLAEERYHL
jgi:NitT/TauT family transport system permease protein